MQFVRQLAATSALVVGLGSTVAAQDRGFVVQVLGGGYSHVKNLNNAGTAHWNTGFTIGGAVGYQLNRYFGLHGDFSLARNQAIGVASFADQTFNRYFYGAHLELRYPLTGTISPFVFAGGGGVTIDPRDQAGFGRFTKAAGMFGAGVSFAIPNSPVAVLVEGKGLTYRWDRGGFDRTQLDVSYALGLAYNFRW